MKTLSCRPWRYRAKALPRFAALAIAGSTVAYAQHNRWFHDHMRMSSEDRAAFTDARIAGVKAGLKLNPDQEKLWPPVETAVRNFAKLRIGAIQSRIFLFKKPRKRLTVRLPPTSDN